MCLTPAALQVEWGELRRGVLFTCLLAETPPHFRTQEEEETIRALGALNAVPSRGHLKEFDPVTKMYT